MSTITINGQTYMVQSTAADITFPKTLVFVYGSLRQGGAMGEFLQNVATWRGEYRTIKPFKLHSLQAFPAAVPGGKKPIIGEVYDLDDERYFSYLDRMEGVERGLYRRVAVEVEGKDKLLTWMYVWGKPTINAPIVPSGDWFDDAV